MKNQLNKHRIALKPIEKLPKHKPQPLSEQLRLTVAKCNELGLIPQVYDGKIVAVRQL